MSCDVWHPLRLADFFLSDRTVITLHTSLFLSYPLFLVCKKVLITEMQRKLNRALVRLAIENFSGSDHLRSHSFSFRTVPALPPTSPLKTDPSSEAKWHSDFFFSSAFPVHFMYPINGKEALMSKNIFVLVFILARTPACEL